MDMGIDCNEFCYVNVIVLQHFHFKYKNQLNFTSTAAAQFYPFITVSSSTSILKSKFADTNRYMSMLTDFFFVSLKHFLASALSKLGRFHFLVS